VNMHFFPPRQKIEIVQFFASRTRQLFVRLLALVKWANNAGKVEKCAVS
uniref:Mediator of RNA polymerase II transcription subunit 14 n=1 Tax=Ficedula albicollis TaxID=59894 RepID=A0A803VD40_FICAL